MPSGNVVAHFQFKLILIFSHFQGRIRVSEDRNVPPKSAGLGLENVVLRGTTLRNTEWIYGCAVYTGEDTKMSMNSKIIGNKFSTVEKSMNKYSFL